MSAFNFSVASYVVNIQKSEGTKRDREISTTDKLIYWLNILLLKYKQRHVLG
jgi:hypothetical protein